MPTGKVVWFDPRSGEGRISYLGRMYPVRTSDIEPRARAAGVRVRFDRFRDAGVVRAVRVQLRPGRRTSPRQHRFGDQVGAHRPDETGHQPLTHDRRPVGGHQLEQHPARVVGDWIGAMRSGDLDTVVLLYAPDAVMHLSDGRVERGPRAVRRWVGTCGLLGYHGLDVRAEHGDTGLVRVRWARTTSSAEDAHVLLRIAHGQIAEQWLIARAVGPTEAQ